jgi:hypothetical protein
VQGYQAAPDARLCNGEAVAMMKAMGVITLQVLLAAPFAPAAERRKIASFSYADFIDPSVSKVTSLSGKDAIARTFRSLRERGFTDVYWRVSGEGHSVTRLYYFNSAAADQMAAAAKEYEGTPYAWDPYELRWPVEAAHREGLRLYAWIVPYNEGVPPGSYARFGDVGPTDSGYVTEQPKRSWPYIAALRTPAGATYFETNFTWQSRFVHDHPEYQSIDRRQKRYHEGLLEWAYPAARQYWLADVKEILDKYAVDGIYMDTRTELMSPEHADQFGFNEPVVKEFARRYGINILEEDFDVEAWRALRGEYFTLFLEELGRLIHAKGKQFSLGTARGDYIGFPLGNMKLEWRKWIAGRIVDEFHVDEHGWGWGPQGYGYVTDFATSRGLKPLDVAVREDYGPLCRAHGVKLYLKCRPPKPRAITDECCHGRATPHVAGVAPDWCRRMAALPEFDGVIEGQKAAP